jgi:hypothetical protein
VVLENLLQVLHSQTLKLQQTVMLGLIQVTLEPMSITTVFLLKHKAEQQDLLDQQVHKDLSQPLCLGGWVYN